MSIGVRIIPYSGTRARLASLPTTGFKGLIALTSDTQEWFVDQGSGDPGIGPGKAWQPVAANNGVLPLVNGDTPGPAFITDGLGQCIGCPLV